MAVERSDKLKWQVYEPSVYEAPYLVYYMKQSSDSYTSSGYSFNIKTPALGAFLDPEVYISYKIRITPNSPGNIAALFRQYNITATDSKFYVANGASNNFLQNNTADGYGIGGCGGSGKFAFRSGNIFQRATQQIVLTVNGFTLNSEPWKWVDIMNRLMVSKEQSKHVFSGSGGAFDSGNHGTRVKQNNRDVVIGTAQVIGGYVGETSLSANASTFKYTFNGGATPPTFVQNDVGIYQSATSDGPIIQAVHHNILTAQAPTGSSTQGMDYLRIFPDDERFYNPGFSDRCYEMMRKCRGDVRDGVTTGFLDGVNCIFPDGTGTRGGWKYFGETGAGQGIISTFPTGNPPGGYMEFIVWEPVPLPPFKMYHNDGVGGIIPHVRDMTLRSTFTANLLANLFQATYDIDDAYNNNLPGGFFLDFSASGNSDCQLFMKWYLPPPSIQIPREISIPLRKVDMYISTTAGNMGVISDNAAYVNTHVAQYNISLDAVPDLLLLYFRLRNDVCRSYHPCDYLCSIDTLTIQLENNGGKLTQIESYQMYQNWLKYIKFDDPVEMTYDEWRKYCCVAALKPDDYGIIRGPGWDNVVVLGVTFEAKNWHNNPSINLCGAENLSSVSVSDSVFNCSGTNMELVVTAVYDRWHLTLSADGTARANLTRIRDLGNALPPAGMGAA